jgi:hypothetical protein
LERQLVVRGTLPPGLQKKMQPCPPDLERMLPPPPPNYAHVVIGGNLVLPIGRTSRLRMSSTSRLSRQEATGW